MRFVLVGPPGSGKGTQAERLVSEFGLSYIGTGVLLRDAIARGTDTGKHVEPLLKQGLLAPDPLVNGVVAELFSGPGRPMCFVMDGYPRTRSQAVAFDSLLHQQRLPLDAVINLTIPDDEVVKRIGGRRCCPNPRCGACYNINHLPPATEGTCDRCGTALILRDDDKEETIRRRLEEFHKNTDSLLSHYRSQKLVRDVSATDPVDVIFDNIIAAVRGNR
ncbi:MAG: adenylate kinase [Planctomycetaceae bacterium]|nr:adenylate kinase [Planctomycetaceae bacterium]